MGKIDLFADKDDKSFDRTKWYFEKMLDLAKNLDSLKKMMRTDEQKEVEVAIKKEDGVEDYIHGAMK